MSNMVKFLKGSSSLLRVNEPIEFDTVIISESAKVIALESSVNAIYACNHDEGALRACVQHKNNEVHISYDYAQTLKGVNVHKPTSTLAITNPMTFSPCTAQDIEIELMNEEPIFAQINNLHSKVDTLLSLGKTDSNNTPLIIILSKSLRRFICKDFAAVYVAIHNKELALFDISNSAKVFLSGGVSDILSVHTKNNARFSYLSFWENQGDINSCLAIAQDGSRICIKAKSFSKLIAKNKAYIDFQANPRIVEAIKFDEGRINYPLKYTFSG